MLFAVVLYPAFASTTDSLYQLQRHLIANPFTNFIRTLILWGNLVDQATCPKVWFLGELPDVSACSVVIHLLTLLHSYTGQKDEPTRWWRLWSSVTCIQIAGEISSKNGVSLNSIGFQVEDISTFSLHTTHSVDSICDIDFIEKNLNT